MSNLQAKLNKTSVKGTYARQFEVCDLLYSAFRFIKIPGSKKRDVPVMPVTPEGPLKPVAPVAPETPAQDTRLISEQRCISHAISLPFACC